MQTYLTKTLAQHWKIFGHHIHGAECYTLQNHKDEHGRDLFAGTRELTRCSSCKLISIQSKIRLHTILELTTNFNLYRLEVLVPHIAYVSHVIETYQHTCIQDRPPEKRVQGKPHSHFVVALKRYQ